MHKVGKVLLIVGGVGIATQFVMNYYEAKSQTTPAGQQPVLPSWYNSTINAFDTAVPFPGGFGWLAIAGAGILIFEKLKKK